mmetsp:Transcript_5261/g.8994  ORF Transcript_5261/g.8994 Transcript_5261/m.8994 type:complete len:138 (-) Transcript_5261:21-434(-)
MTKLLHAAAVVLLFSGPALAQEFQHQRRIPHRPDRPSIREMVTQKYERQEELLTNMMKQRQAAVDDHLSGRKLLGDEEFARHQRHVKGLHRKLAAAKQKDPQLVKLEIEHEIELQEKMMAGEFIWTPGAEDLVLKDP